VVVFPNRHICLLRLQIAHTTSVEVYSKTLAPVDYHVIGDIFSVSVDSDNATFNLNAEQYLYTTRSSEAFPIRCIIPDSPKFGNYKPIPRNGKSISVTGFLTGLKHNEDKTVKHFITSRSLASQWDLLRQRPKSVRPRYVCVSISNLFVLLLTCNSSQQYPSQPQIHRIFCEWLQSEESAPTKQPARN
jgi:hypothetical protein